MKKFIYSVFAFLLAYNFFKPNLNAANSDLVLSQSEEPSIYSGHHSHCSHCSHFSSMTGSRSHEIHLTKHDSISPVSIDSKYIDYKSKYCIVKSYVADVELKNSTQFKFNGKAMVISVMDDYGNYSRSPRIKVTTHIIPLDVSVKIYFTINGHLGYNDRTILTESLNNDLQAQFKEEWLVRDKKMWMNIFDSNFYDNIIELTW